MSSVKDEVGSRCLEVLEEMGRILELLKSTKGNNMMSFLVFFILFFSSSLLRFFSPSFLLFLSFWPLVSNEVAQSSRGGLCMN